uniref:Uncharacterized protein n=1 Tax=Panagrolaimus superbus TaxID=310955 RepID=A0A914YIY9_9BILA
MGNQLPAGEAVENLDSQKNVHISNERDQSLKQLASEEGSNKELSPSKVEAPVLTNIEPVDQAIHTIWHKYQQLPFMKFRMFILAFLVPLCFILPSKFILLKV